MNYKGEWQTAELAPKYPLITLTLIPKDNGELNGTITVDSNPGAPIKEDGDDTYLSVHFIRGRVAGSFIGKPTDANSVKGTLDIGEGIDRKEYPITLKRKQAEEERNLTANDCS